jgi:RNA polymerase sigma factor (TIGR02999 family)
MSGASQNDITMWLKAWQQGDSDAEERLLAETYDELKRLARAQLRSERSGHTLQPTALVNEAYARMTGLKLEWKDRVHYLSMAARCMRRVLVDYARKRDADKRGAGAAKVTLDGDEIEAASPDVDLLDLDRALERLAVEVPAAATAVELHYFAGLSQAEIGEVMGVSESTAYRSLRFGRAWLRTALDTKTR